MYCAQLLPSFGFSVVSCSIIFKRHTFPMINLLQVDFQLVLPSSLICRCDRRLHAYRNFGIAFIYSLSLLLQKFGNNMLYCALAMAQFSSQLNKACTDYSDLKCVAKRRTRKRKEIKTNFDGAYRGAPPKGSKICLFLFRECWATCAHFLYSC